MADVGEPVSGGIDGRHRDPEVFVYELRRGCEAEYDRHHAAVWPEVIAEIRASGIVEYTIHRRETLVISVLRYTAPSTAGRVLLPPDVQRRVDEWHDLMAPLFVAVSDDDGEPLYADLIFDLNQY